MPNELMLVGSIPLDTVQEVFETFGKPLGKYLFAMPDGEVGPRRHWISRVHYQVLSGHQDLDTVRQKLKEETDQLGQSMGVLKVAIAEAAGASSVLADLGPTPLSPEPSGYSDTIRSLVASPDGKRLAFGYLQPDSHIWMLDAANVDVKR